MEGQIWEASSYLVSIFGSILLWISYAIFGLIARRYRQVFGHTTYSTLLILAPSGLLFYTLYLILKATPVLDTPSVSRAAEWLAYFALLGSGAFCLLGVARFSSVLTRITKSATAAAEIAAGKGAAR
jgi:hypothetical protein